LRHGSIAKRQASRIYRACARWRWIRSYEKSLNERAKVEQELLDCAAGRRPLPDQDQCRQWAVRLGVPSWWRD